MKAVIAATLLVAGAQAATFDAVSAFSTLIADASSISSAAAAFKTDLQPLQDLSDKTIKDIQAADAGTSGATPYDAVGASGLITPVTSLAAAVKGAVNEIVSRKSDLVAAGGGSRVYAAIVAQSQASAKFSTDLQALVPVELRSIASGYAKSIDDAFSSGVAQFEDVKNSSGGAGSSPTGGSSSSPTGSAPVSSSTSASASGPGSASSTGAGVSPTGSSTTAATSPIATGAAPVMAASGLGAGIILAGALFL